MKKSKRLLLGLMIAVAVQLSIAAKADPSHYRHIVVNNEAIITRYIGPGGDITIPATLGGRPVTMIGTQAFYSSFNITAVTIPDSVTAIGSEGFYACKGMTSATLGKSIASIGARAFGGCTRLTRIHVALDHPNYSSVDGVLFNQKKNQIVVYPGGKAGAYVIPDTVAKIGFGAFFGCTDLTSVTIPSTVTTIDEAAFFNCSRLTNVIIPNRVTVLSDGTFANCTSLTSVTIPDSVTVLGKGVFNWCTSLTSVTIGNRVTAIGRFAFARCHALPSVSIPASVTTIDDQAFRDTRLVSIHVEPDNLNFSSVDGVLFNHDKSILLIFPNRKGGAYALPDTVTAIADSAFEQCTLSSLTIPDSVTSIGKQAFRNTNHLTDVTIGKRMTSIGLEAFDACFGLANVHVAPDNPKFSSVEGVLYDKGKSRILLCPPKKTGAHVIPDTITTIADSAFERCSLTSITIPDSVTSIGNKAFYSCAKLAELTLGKGITTIGESAFGHCAKLEKVYFAGHAPRVGNAVFAHAPTTIYYRPHTTGWSTTFAKRPTAIWNSTP